MKILTLLLLLSYQILPAQEITNTKELVEQLYRNKDQRYETLTFVQTTISYNKEGEADTATWYEALAPGKLRIDFEAPKHGNGVLYLGDMRYDFKEGKLMQTVKDYNSLMLFLSEIFYVKPARSIYLMDSLGFDFNKFYLSNWNGKEIYIIGAEPNDTSQNQVWIDKELLLPVRIIDMVGKNKDIRLDAHISGYKNINDKYVETIIKIYVNGKIVQEEYYNKIKVNPKLNPGLFNPESFITEQRYWE